MSCLWQEKVALKCCLCVSDGELLADKQDIGEQIVSLVYIPTAHVPTFGDSNYGSCDV